MKLNSTENGIVHLGLIIAVTATLVVGSVAYWRVSSANNKKLSISDTAQIIQQEDVLPANLDQLKTLEEIEKIAGADTTNQIVKFVLEKEGSAYVYKITLSTGKVLVINAATGVVMSEEKTDISEDDKIPAGVQVSLTPIEAYKIAATRSTSPIKSIEMEVEDRKVVYKIEYKDGSKIELNATDGTVVKSEIKNESENREENKTEDHQNEDSDDSIDSEDHEEEDSTQEVEDEEDHEDNNDSEDSEDR